MTIKNSFITLYYVDDIKLYTSMVKDVLMMSVFLGLGLVVLGLAGIP